MATGNYITDKVQTALVAFLATKTFTNIVSASIYKGVQRTPASVATAIDEQASPRVECVCQRATRETVAPIDGNWVAVASVEITSNADDTAEDNHHLNSAEVLSHLVTDSIALDLSSALADFTAFSVYALDQSWEITGRSWVSKIGLEIHCCGSDIS